MKIKTIIREFLVSCFITYLLLAINNVFWNINDLSQFEWCFYENCSTGLFPIFYSIVMNVGDWATIIFGGIIIPLLFGRIKRN